MDGKQAHGRQNHKRSQGIRELEAEPRRGNDEGQRGECVQKNVPKPYGQPHSAAHSAQVPQALVSPEASDTKAPDNQWPKNRRMDSCD